MSGSGCLNQFYYNKEPYLYGDYWSIDSLPGMQLRGRPPRKGQPSTICIGAAATFGRFVTRPFPEQINAINLGLGAASPATFIDDRLLEVINRAERVILQIPTARSETTTMWSQQKNKIGLPFDTVMNRDGWLMRADEAWHGVVDKPDATDRIAEARQSWTQNMRRLIKKIDPPVTLLWLSRREPDYKLETDTLWKIYQHYPQLVTQYMVNQITPLASRYVECIWESQDGEYYPTQAAHDEVARLLQQ